MNRGAKPVSQAVAATVETATVGQVAVVEVSGLVDERFTGFGSLGTPTSVVINTAGITRMTSFGVRQWLKAMEAVPKSVSELLLLGCPTFFVDQLNMVLNFGAGAKVLTVTAPYTCTSCGVESGETIDVLAERINLANGGVPEKQCARCGGKLEFDESPESYFSFVNKYAAAGIQPDTADALDTRQLYFSQDFTTEKPPRIIKLVHESVTYFRIIGSIASMFRARPFLVGAEGEVVIDLNEVDRYDVGGHNEWRRLLKGLSTLVPAITLVDVKQSFIPLMGKTLTIGDNISVASILLPYACIGCGKVTHESELLHETQWPLELADIMCTSCDEITRPKLDEAAMAALDKLSRSAPPASAKVIADRSQILARALTDANAAQSADANVSSPGSDDAILGKYKIVRTTAKAGAGAEVADVFLAKQVGIGGFEKPVVLKKISRKLLDERQQSVEQFFTEIKSAGRLTHPSIVQVLDVGEVDASLYLAMEYVHGKTVLQILEKLNGPLPTAEALYIVREVAAALDHAYWSTDMAAQQLGIVHGNVSPRNIIISNDGAVKLNDFGVTMAALSAAADAQYMAPESSADGEFEHQSDLFSLGVLLYMLCSGVPPFTGANSKAIVKKMRAGKFKPLHQIVDVPPRLDDVLAYLLSPNIVDRQPRGQDVVTQLNDIARQNRLESSGPALAAMLARLFPEGVAPRGDEPASATGESRRASTNIPRFDAAIPRDAQSLDHSVSIRPGQQPSKTPTGQSSPAIRPARPPDKPIAKPPAPTSGKSPLSTILLIVVLLVVAAGAYFFVSQS